MTTCCRRLLFLKHKEEKTHKKTTKEKIKKRWEFILKLPFYPFTFGSHFYPSISNTFSSHLLLFK
jgi:hypothetical protein